MNGPSDTQIMVQRVSGADAGELLTLRRAAFVTEAQHYGDPNIPPLTQTLAELRADLADHEIITIGAWSGNRLIGSVRVQIEGDKATLGSLAVAPDMQGRGIGTHMLREVLPFLPDQTTEIWVFTGKGSAQDLSLYTSDGYEEQHDQAAGDLTYTYLRRILGQENAREESASA